MSHVLLGGHPAIDFLNTSLAPDGEPVEKIPDGKSYLTWLTAVGLLDAARASKLARRFGTEALDAAAAEARRTREWARAFLVRWRARPNGNYDEEIGTLNKLLARDVHSSAVHATEDGLSMIESPQIANPEALVALLAGQIAALITTEQPSLVRECAGSACTLWFLDRTKAHRRMFCSASACGNRAKVAAFRERQRS
jgi:predicted RNA-binding Zn ribbon-like protein